MSEIIITTTDIDLATILIQIGTELRRAEAKHPVWPTDPVYMDQIVNEEKGEVTRAVVQYCIEKTGTLQEVRTELIQTAAVCVRMLKMLEK